MLVDASRHSYFFPSFILSRASTDVALNCVSQLWPLMFLWRGPHILSTSAHFIMTVLLNSPFTWDVSGTRGSRLLSIYSVSPFLCLPAFFNSIADKIPPPPTYSSLYRFKASLLWLLCSPLQAGLRSSVLSVSPLCSVIRITGCAVAD